MGEEQAQKLEFLEGESNAFAVCGDGMLVKINYEAAGLEEMLYLLGRTAAQYGLYAGDQLHYAERLCDIVIRAQVEPLYFIVLRAFGGSHYHGYGVKLRGGFHTAKKLYAVYAGQHNIQHYQLGPLLLQRFPK